MTDDLDPEALLDAANGPASSWGPDGFSWQHAARRLAAALIEARSELAKWEPLIDAARAALSPAAPPAGLNGPDTNCTGAPTPQPGDLNYVGHIIGGGVAAPTPPPRVTAHDEDSPPPDAAPPEAPVDAS